MFLNPTRIVLLGVDTRYRTPPGAWAFKNKYLSKYRVQKIASVHPNAARTILSYTYYDQYELLSELQQGEYNFRTNAPKEEDTDAPGIIYFSFATASECVQALRELAASNLTFQVNGKEYKTCIRYAHDRTKISSRSRVQVTHSDLRFLYHLSMLDASMTYVNPFELASQQSVPTRADVYVGPSVAAERHQTFLALYERTYDIVRLNRCLLFKPFVCVWRNIELYLQKHIGNGSEETILPFDPSESNCKGSMSIASTDSGVYVSSSRPSPASSGSDRSMLEPLDSDSDNNPFSFFSNPDSPFSRGTRDAYTSTDDWNPALTTPSDLPKCIHAYNSANVPFLLIPNPAYTGTPLWYPCSLGFLSTTCASYTNASDLVQPDSVSPPSQDSEAWLPLSALDSKSANDDKTFYETQWEEGESIAYHVSSSLFDQPSKRV